MFSEMLQLFIYINVMAPFIAACSSIFLDSYYITSTYS